MIAKPDIGGGVRRIEDVAALREYLRDFPAGEKLMLQRFVPHTGEATVLYARLPGMQSGRILSLTVRYGSHLTGDDRTSTAMRAATLRRSSRRGSTRSRAACANSITAASICASPRPKSSCGESISRIVEISGIGSEADRACDPSLPLAEIYRRLIDQQRIMFLIGEKNRARGFEPVTCAEVLKSLVRRSQLGRRYPASA